MHIRYFIIALSLVFATACIQACSDDKPRDITPPAPIAEDSIKARVPNEFIDILFADQSIGDVAKIADARTIGNRSVWTDFLAATQLALQKKNDESIAAFHLIADNRENEPRVRLWAWNGIRGLGERPKKLEVLGIVLEVPQQGSTEFLAMYANKKAIYINYTGMVAVWDEHQRKMDGLIDAAFADAVRVVTKQALAQGRSFARTNSVRFSFLTTDGLYQAERGIDALNDPKDDLTHIFATSAQMLGEMVTKAKSAGKK